MLPRKKMSNNLNDNQKLSPEEKAMVRRRLSRTTMDLPYQPRSGYIVHGLVKSTLSIALLVAFPGISILYAAEKALPNQGILYDLKRGGEEFVASFYTSPNDQIAFRESQIKRRVEEATQLALRGSMKPAHADVLSQDIAAHVASAEATLEDNKKTESEGLEPKESVKRILAVQQKVLAAVAETQPGETKESITAIKETTAALENGLTGESFSPGLEVSLIGGNESLLVNSEIENLLVVARLELKKVGGNAPRSTATSTDGYASTSQEFFSVTATSSSAKIILGETRELTGANEALENLQQRFETLKSEEKSEDSFENILMDVKVFLALLESDVSLVTGFSFTRTGEVDSLMAASSTDIQASQGQPKSVQVKASSTKEILQIQDSAEVARDLLEPANPDLAE